MTLENKIMDKEFTVEETKEFKDYEMPEVSVGAIVHYFPSPDRTPTTAVVTTVGQCTLGLSLIARGQKLLVLQNGIRHKDDPNYRSDRGVGFWDFTPESKNTAMMKAAIDDLMHTKELAKPKKQLRSAQEALASVSEG